MVDAGENDRRTCRATLKRKSRINGRRICEKKTAITRQDGGRRNSDDGRVRTFRNSHDENFATVKTRRTNGTVGHVLCPMAALAVRRQGGCVSGTFFFHDRHYQK